ncbi:MAG: ComF family protein [Nitrospirae bacterium]|nr:ComF family protein [Nitrospirota bacterium]
MINKFLRLLFPESCPICKGPAMEHRTSPICPACWGEISPYSDPSCKRCGKPLVSDVSIICGECIEDEPAFEWARSFGLYEGILKEAINHFKYYGKKRLAKPIGDFLLKIDLPVSSGDSPWRGVDAIVPVPMHHRKLKQREFNQSALLARELSLKNKLPMLLNCLIKVKDTMPQVGLGAKERAKNIKRAFEVRDRASVHGMRIALVDDVYTTGATVRECAKVLKRAGAKEVYVVTVAHGGGDL